MIAQGGAQRSPGSRIPITTLALKGRATINLIHGPRRIGFNIVLKLAEFLLKRPHSMMFILLDDIIIVMRFCIFLVKIPKY
jgi:hypothetical protein